VAARFGQNSFILINRPRGTHDVRRDPAIFAAEFTRSCGATVDPAGLSRSSAAIERTTVARKMDRYWIPAQ
jgi:hypothetical protein